MNQDEIKRTMVLLSTVESGKGKKLMHTLNGENIKMHMQTVGEGTAPTEMMDILGLGTNSKDIIISFANEAVVNKLMTNFGDNFASYSEYGGLMMVLKLSAINRLAAEIISHNLTSEQVKGGEVKMKNAHNHNLVMITVAQGYTDQVMETAKKAGATGGTVIRGRIAETEMFSELANMDSEEEREIIFILAPAKVSCQIMEDVNKKFGLRSEAKGILCSVPVEKAYKI